MLLDFEKPIALLEDKLSSLKEERESGKGGLDKIISKLENEISILRKEVFENLTRWQRVQLSRHPDRPYTLDYIENISSEFFELHGDRAYGDDTAIVGGLAQIGSEKVMIIGHQKGRNTKERQYRNFGMANPEGYRKAVRLMKLAEKFDRPIVVFIDTPGAFPGIEAEERGQAAAIAVSIQTMFSIRVPIVVTIIGEGASGGAIGIGVGDKVLMLENTWYSVISPESCSVILWKNIDYKEEAADKLRLTAKDMKEMKLIDDIVKEPLGGAHRDVDSMYLTLKKEILKQIKSMSSVDKETLLEKRHKKYYSMGIVK